jgi:hypothetical protein
MFFRREKAQELTFEQRIQNLSGAGFQASLRGEKAVVMRGHYAAVVGSSPLAVKENGMIVGKEIGELVHGGFQMFFQTPSGEKRPALAEQLKALHAFNEDLRDALGITSLYNESLGTTNDKHLYDRVKDRDAGVPKRPWE